MYFLGESGGLSGLGVEGGGQWETKELRLPRPVGCWLRPPGLRAGPASCLSCRLLSVVSLPPTCSCFPLHLPHPFPPVKAKFKPLTIHEGVFLDSCVHAADGLVPESRSRGWGHSLELHSALPLRAW